MESKNDALPPLPTPIAYQSAIDKSSPLPSFPPQTSTVHVTLPLSPLSIPHSPASHSPSSPAPSVFNAEPLCPFLHPLSSRQPVDAQNSHCLNSPTTSDQDDLTCLSWLHQREDSPDKRLPVKDIYEWIVNNFPYYREAPGGWRNSVRHNLSLSKSFRRIHRNKSQSVGKGSLWCVCPEYRPALQEVLRKSHYYHTSNVNLLNNPAFVEGTDYGVPVVYETVEISDSLSQTLLLPPPSPPALTSDNPTLSSNPPCPLTPEHEELVNMEGVGYEEEIEGEMEKDPLSDSGYIELHYYQYHQYQYLVLPGDTELDLETVEILQLDADAQEAAGSLLDLAGGGH
ncbi:hypothetical protein UPYG_G00216530 [Umbra pygmaea]|uniref:Fork-head domain-containing protein n=1 Tax=Umbra pygmaea TaxID=75934 RepID=A0ABD0WKV8_UMBPY